MSRTPTTRLALSKPNPGTSEPYDASVDLGSNWDKVDGAVGALECTNATRPTGADAWAGRIISETDTNKMYIREGGAWRQIVVNTGTSVPIDDDVSVTGTLTVSSTMINANPVVEQEVIIADGTWTKPTGAKSVMVECLGGGGAGGGAASTAAGQCSAGGGGQSGAYARSWFAASALGATVTVDIGAGGTGVSAAAGNAGADTTFGAGEAYEVRAAAGNGGTVLAASATSGTTPAGTVTQTNVGQFTVRGNAGAWGMRNGPDAGGSGGGGAGSYFGGATPGTGNVTGASAAANTGAGGAGSSNNASGAAKAGGTGGSGVCIVTTYFN